MDNYVPYITLAILFDGDDCCPENKYLRRWIVEMRAIIFSKKCILRYRSAMHFFSSVVTS
jgi:hypothetical protein